MSRLLSRPAQIQQEIEDILNWAELLEVVVWSLESDLEHRLRALPRQLKTLIVGEDSPVLFDLCSAARVSRSQRSAWNGDLLVGRKQGQVRAVLGSWGSEQVQPVTCMQGTESPSELEDLEHLLQTHRTESRLAAGSAITGSTQTLASPMEPIGMESLTLLSSQEGCQQAMQRLQGELQRASVKHKSCLIVESRVEVWAARGQALYWCIQAQGLAQWTFHLATLPPQGETWLPCPISLDSHSSEGLRFACEGARTFLACLDRPESLSRLKGVTINSVQRADASVLGVAGVIAELGRTDLVRRLAEFAQQWEKFNVPAPVPAKIPVPDVAAPLAPPKQAAPPTKEKPHLILDKDVDDFDLEAALEGLPDHAVVEIGPITLRLKKPVNIRRTLTLQGSGMDQTRVACKTLALGGVLNFEGEGPWTLCDLTVERAKGVMDSEYAERNCVRVKGEIDVTRCRFLGATGAGLYFGGNSRGLVTQCEARENLAGIVVSEYAMIRLEGNICHSNIISGIEYGGHAGGVVQDNRCENNGAHGIYLNDGATTILDRNHCSMNRGNGIEYSGNAGGLAEGNQCCENEGVGIVVEYHAVPVLSQNHCLRNKDEGIQITGDATPVLAGNQCCENLHGIIVRARAAPTLVDNHCLLNRRNGIFYREKTSGSAKGNQCSDNERFGIRVNEQATPTLKDNLCQRNKIDEIFYSGGAKEQIRPPASVPTPAVPPVTPKPDSPILDEAKPHLTLDKDTDDFDLEAAMKSLPDHAVVQLGPITLRLKKPVTIKKPLTIWGAGMDQTRIVCETSALEGILNFKGKGPWTLCGFTVERVQGGTKRDSEFLDSSCVTVEGQIDIRGCRFMDAPGTGLLCCGQSQGLVTQCEAQENFVGICLSATSKIDLKDNTCSDNGSAGIRYLGQASGVAQGNRCENNGLHGIQVGDQADPALEDNQCLRSLPGGCGISYTNHTGGFAKGNECSENGDSGISLSDHAAPTLEGNHCLRNQHDGIYYENAGGVAKGNHCSDSVLGSGISLVGDAAPTLEGNHCLRNGYAGISYSDNAGGIAKGNECSENDESGIRLSDHAAPTLEGNQCLRHQYAGHAGISYGDNAGGIAKGNECSENAGPGIGLANHAAPTLEGNHCLRNRCGSGISYSNHAGGIAKGNECSKNRDGITVGGWAAPTLSENQCLRNKADGIDIRDDATPTLHGNQCLRNKRGGISYYGRAGGTAKGNECCENESGILLGAIPLSVEQCVQLGIHFDDNATPTLEDNQCLRNKQNGIGYFGRAGGTARGNQCCENDCGICVGGHAVPTFEANHCLRNSGYGIFYCQTGGGTARENQCCENDASGICVTGEATPALEANHCLRNKHDGMSYCKNGGGFARGNKCCENDGFGINVLHDATPALEGNQCLRNTVDGISYSTSPKK